jgi:FkbM family methyltransferase
MMKLERAFEPSNAFEQSPSRADVKFPSKAGRAPAPPSGDPQVTEADIRAAYRLLLGRDVEAGGLQHYLGRARSGTFSLDDLVHSVSDSYEYIARKAGRLTTVDVNGLRISIDPEEPEFGQAIARDRMWEAHITHQIAINLRPGDVFVDIGANVGIMSFHAARAVGSSGKVIAFEPNPDNIQHFLRGVLLNEFKHVTLFPLAASAETGIFAIQGNSNTCLSRANVGGRLVQSVRADTLLGDEPRVDFIKLDIEGHEPHALVGLTETLKRHRPLLLCEFAPRCLREHIGADPAEFAHNLFNLSRRVEVIEHDGSLNHVTDPEDLLALWHSRNEENIARGHLADGLLHFDLLIHVR